MEQWEAWWQSYKTFFSSSSQEKLECLSQPIFFLDRLMFASKSGAYLSGALNGGLLPSLASIAPANAPAYLRQRQQ